MEKYTSSNAVREAIVELERQQALDSRQISVQLLNAFDSLKPINLIKDTFKGVAESKDLTDNIVKTSLGLAAGYVTQRLFHKPTHGPVRRLFGMVVSYGVTSFLATHPEILTVIGLRIGHFFKKMIKKSPHTEGVEN